MSDPVITDLRSQLLRDEGVRLHPYLDCCGKPWRECVCRTKGKLTIGTGRNLDDTGIAMDENDLMLANDLRRATAAVVSRIPTAEHLDDVRLGVLVNLAFNLGIEGLLGFPKFLAAVAARDWPTSAKEMLDSTWHRQVGQRAERLAEQMETGEWR